MTHPFSRRGLLSLGAAALGSLGVRWSGLPVAGAAEIAPAAAGKTRALRLAHLTDIHVQPELSAGPGLAACLKHVQSLKDAPTLILNGGDSVMDVFGKDAARAKAQADIFRSVLKQECSLRVEHCIGNHDVWGWNKKNSQTTGDEANWGKPWALDLFGINRRYRSFDVAGWHFIVLDSTFPAGTGYTARLDDEQFDWLAKDLAATPPTTPVCVLSHIPILAVSAFMDGENEKSGDWKVPGAWMHIDARQIGKLFLKHPNVKLCLSGHLHLHDQCLYNNVWYICNGAVSGGWWKGSYHECAEGYGLVDLYADGTFDAQYVGFGWKAAKA